MADDTHPILKNSEPYREYLAAQETCRRQGQALRRQGAEARAAQEAQIRAHREAVATALREEAPIPPPPPEPDLTHLRVAEALQANAERELLDRYGQVLAEVARSGALEGCRERLRLGQAAAAKAVATLDTARADAQATLALYAELLAAVDSADAVGVSPSRAQRVRTSVGFDEFAASIRNRLDLAELLPVAGLTGGGGDPFRRRMVIDGYGSKVTRADEAAATPRSPREHREKILGRSLADESFDRVAEPGPQARASRSDVVSAETRCANGHAWSPRTEYWRTDQPGHRACRRCRADACFRWRRRVNGRRRQHRQPSSRPVST